MNATSKAAAETMRYMTKKHMMTAMAMATTRWMVISQGAKCK